MNVTQLWTRIVHWLDAHAPVTAAALRQPDPAPDFADLQQRFGIALPAELREWWGACGGTDDDVLADVLPPFYTPYGAHRSWEVWSSLRTTWDEKWERPVCDYYAGSSGSSFHPAWIPIAGDGFADELIVDLRPGPLHGCVMEWEHEAARVTRPEWAGVCSMLTDVHRALMEGVPAGHSHPTVTEDGRLDWQIK